MGKLFTPQDVASGFNTTNSLNTNFDNIETALDRTLSRYGETPNAMETHLDMNTFNILNVGTIDADVLLVDGEEVPSLESLQILLDQTEIDLAGYVAAAQAEVVNAQAEVTNAQVARTAAELAETNAEAAQAAAEAAVASLNIPTIAPGDAGKRLEVNPGETAYELYVPTLEAVAATPSTVMVRDAAGRSQVADPSAAADIATKSYVDNLSRPVLLQSFTGFPLATVTDLTVFSSYPQYSKFFIVARYFSDTAAGIPTIQVSIDGSTLLAGTNYYYVLNRIRSSTATNTIFENSGVASAQLASNDVDINWEITIEIDNANVSWNRAHPISVKGYGTTNEVYRMDGIFSRTVGGDLTGFRLSNATGLSSDGFYQAVDVYGVNGI